MALPDVGVPFTPQTRSEVRDAILTDIRLGTIEATGEDPAVSPGTENYIFADAYAGASMIQYANIAAERDGVTPLNSTGTRLDEWRESIGLPVVSASASTGQVRIQLVSGAGSVTIAEGAQFVFPNGLRGKVSVPSVGVPDGGEVDAIAIDTGSKTNFDGGAQIRFVSPPSGMLNEAFVSKNVPFTGGLDAEDDARKLKRIQNAIANKAGGGSWAQLREVAFEALASVQDCFVYPALGGPSSTKVVPVRDFDLDFGEYTRALTTAALNVVRDAIYRKVADAAEVVVQTVVDENVDAAIAVEIPASTQSGGDGTGWLDAAPWPVLVGGDNGRVSVTTVTSTKQITVNAGTSTTPIAGVTRIAWWSPNDRRFRTFLVTAVSGSSGAWVLTVDQPMVDSDGNSVASGAFISPAAVNIVEYGKSWVDVFRAIGPGENLVTSEARYKRHPYVTKESPPDLGFLAKKTLVQRHREIVDIDWGYRSITTPTVPVLRDTAPNVLVPRHFAIYST